jgi:hypothetical protein
MRKLLSLFLVFFLTLAVIKPHDAHAEMPAKAKAILTMAGYGVAGGALLGIASMAFGNTSRAVAQGASLGLYAGLIFGGYVLISHHNKQVGSYQDDSSPYKESNDVYGDEYDAEEGGEANPDDRSKRGGFFDRFQVMQEHVANQSFTFDSEKKKGGSLPPIQMNIIQYNF